MQYKLTAPRQLNTKIELPASKSIGNRALIIHALSSGAQMPTNLSDCDDTVVILRALRDMPDVIDIKAAGTAMRFLTAYLAVTPGVHVITGTERMRHRPIAVLVDALRYLGADIAYTGEKGFPPLRVSGKPFDGGWLEVSGNISSQFISALLMIGPVLKDGLTLRLTGEVISRPYIDLTLCMMRDFGARAEWSDIDTITVAPQTYIDRCYTIENDWSAASYWYEMMALGACDTDELVLTGLMDGSCQGDSAVRYIFSLLGIKTEFERKGQGIPMNVTLKRTRHCVPKLEYDFVNTPDLAQTFVVACALMNVNFHFTGLATLKIKETDRIEALKAEMRKLGYVVHDNNGSELIWNGERCEPDWQQGIDTYEDHRMALAFAPAAFIFPELIINDAQVVTKSYPHYWEDLKQAGFSVEKIKSVDEVN